LFYESNLSSEFDYFFAAVVVLGIYTNQVRHNSPQDGLKPHQRRALFFYYL